MQEGGNKTKKKKTHQTELELVKNLKLWEQVDDLSDGVD